MSKHKRFHSLKGKGKLNKTRGFVSSHFGLAGQSKEKELPGAPNAEQLEGGTDLTRPVSASNDSTERRKKQ